MERLRRRSRAARALGGLIAVSAAVALGLSGCATANTATDASSTPSPTEEAPAGVVEDAFQVGDGPIVVDLFSDASCPHCKTFDAEVSGELEARIATGEITYRLHPANYVSEKRGDDTDFSTRVMNLLAVASDHGQVDIVPAVYAAVIAEQAPTLDDPMPDDERMMALAEGAGLEIDDAMRAEIVDGRWAEWVQAVNDRHVGQPIGDTGEVLSGVPTMLIDGVVFDIREDGTDLARLLAALDA